MHVQIMSPYGVFGILAAVLAVVMVSLNLPFICWDAATLHMRRTQFPGDGRVRHLLQPCIDFIPSSTTPPG
jgi:hypothetical protein